MNKIQPITLNLGAWQPPKIASAPRFCYTIHVPDPSLLILIPAYNEERRIEPVLREYAEFFRKNYTVVNLGRLQQALDKGRLATPDVLDGAKLVQGTVAKCSRAVSVLPFR